MLPDMDALSIRHTPCQTGRWTAFALVIGLGGAPRRNRTGDPILTMYPRPTAMRRCVFPGVARYKWCSYGVAAVVPSRPSSRSVAGAPRLVRNSEDSAAAGAPTKAAGHRCPTYTTTLPAFRWSVSRVRHPAAEGVKKQADLSATMPVLAVGSRLPVRAGRPTAAARARRRGFHGLVDDCERLGVQSVEVDLVMQAELAA
jgi:hypothetical protein